ncbi:hypothetical protein OCU04_010029 [Sclerotinia nivalis]|uniref:Uncharacterized protein n=1 Tax=Sclerotinia nivalis TaxID=352851 RepID=A0A9X0ADQ9_9HELO|nr:hypothetical protein OCU04_010029 [Sclerotinia nivalis]
MSDFSMGDRGAVFVFVCADKCVDKCIVLDAGVKGEENGEMNGKDNANEDERVQAMALRKYGRSVSLGGTLVRLRDEGGEQDDGDERDEENGVGEIQVPEKVVVRSVGDGDRDGDGKVDGDMEKDAEKSRNDHLVLKKNPTEISMGGLEVLVRDEDGETVGDGLGMSVGTGVGVDKNGGGYGSDEVRGGKVMVMRWDEVAEWRQDNEYILTGYRPETKSSFRSIRSVFNVHNETVNIHSHLFGALLFSLLPIYIYHTLIPRYPTATTAEIIVFALFFTGVAICFALSCLYHTLNNHSHKIASFWLELDFLGIVVLMWGSMVATIYHGFICDGLLRWVYWSMISTLSLLLLLSTLLPPFRTPTFRPYRTLMYACLGLSALVFIIHSIILYGTSVQYKRLSLGWILGTAGLNFLGAGAYCFRVGFFLFLFPLSVACGLLEGFCFGVS